MFVLNVIGKGAAPALFGRLGLGPAAILAEDHAFDLPVTGNASGVLVEARALAQGLALDINLVATAHRRKKLLVADMDSTIIAVECLDELAAMAGLTDKIAPITDRAMTGEIAFEGALRERVAMLKGLPLSALEQVWAERVRLNPGAKSLIATMRAQGAHTVLVSSGFEYFTRRVAEAAGFHAHHGNRVLDDGARLTGEMGLPIQDSDAKSRIMEETAAQLGAGLEDCLAVGDGANDLAMIERAGLGVAYHARAIVAAAADAIIAHNDLTALLYLQGFLKSEIKG